MPQSIYGQTRKKKKDAEPQTFAVQADEGDIDIQDEIEAVGENARIEIQEGQIAVQPP